MTDFNMYQTVLSGFTAALNAMRLYPVGHRQTQGAIDKCWSAMTGVFRGEAEIALLVMDDAVFINGRPLPGAGTSAEALSGLMRKKAVDRLTFRKGLSKEQLTGFLSNLSSKDDTVVNALSHIKLGKIVTGPEAHTAPEAAEDGASELKHHDQAVRDLKTLFDGVHRSRIPKGADINAFAIDFVKTFNAAARPLGYLADIKSEDQYTFVHTVNVALLTIGLASRYGLPESAMSDIACAALMHDVGKLFVPDEILNKNGALDPKERNILELHPIRGAHHLWRMGGLPLLARVVALEHHIKYDGTGYPHMGAVWKPHWISQMVTIADIFDALRSRRPYRDPMEQQPAFKILRNSVGTILNPELVDRFIAMVELSERPCSA